LGIGVLEWVWGFDIRDSGLWIRRGVSHFCCMLTIRSVRSVSSSRGGGLPVSVAFLAVLFCFADSAALPWHLFNPTHPIRAIREIRGNLELGTWAWSWDPQTLERACHGAFYCYIDTSSLVAQYPSFALGQPPFPYQVIR